MTSCDLFISYRRKDVERIEPLLAALEQRGISVWLDRHEISDFAAITDTIRDGLASSRALLAWYSEEYPTSRPCQMELTAALLAAEREGDPRRRVLVVNPAPSPAHIEPVELRDALYASAPSDAAGYARLGQAIARHVMTLDGPLGGLLPLVPPTQYGRTLTGSNRFVGRLPDLWRIHSALHARENAVVSATTAPGLAILSGLGGVGKSLLAEEYALRFGGAYPGGVFWLRAHALDQSRAPVTSWQSANEVVRLERFGALAMQLGIDVRGLAPSVVEGLLRARLSHDGRPFLWIVDDLPAGLEADAVRGWLAPAPLGKSLVTTRSQEYRAIGAAVPLDVFTPHEAIDLLCSQRRPVGPDEMAAAHGLAADLGYHALALDVTAAALAAQTALVSFAGARANLANPHEDELEFAAQLAGMLPSGHEKSVAATLRRSLRDLPEEGHDFLRLASLIATAPIPPALVAATFLCVDGLPDIQATRRAVLAQTQVEHASLAKPAGDGARSVHVLVSRTVRFRDADPARTQALRAAAVTALAHALQLVDDVRTHAALALHVQHARALIATSVEDPDSAGLASLVARHDFRRGLFSSAKELEGRILATCRRILGDEAPSTLASMNNLAETLRALGDFAGARSLLERGLDVHRRLLGDEHPTTLTSLNNLALTLAAQGDYAGARGLQERLLDASRRVLGDDDPTTLTSLNNLALTMEAQGDYAGARGLQERVVDASRRVLGDDHPDTLTSLNNLALTMKAQGAYAAARQLQERVLQARRRVLGDEHPDTLAGMANLAEMLSAQRDFVGAQQLEERVLDARRRLLGEEHPATLVTMNNLAETLRAQEDLAGARQLQERVLDARRRLLGDEHPDTLASMHNLAGTLVMEGDLAGARALQERVLDTARRVLGDEHPDTLKIMGNLAGMLLVLRDMAGARQLQECVLDASRRVLGDEHPNTLMIMGTLALTLREQADFAGARALQERVLDVTRRALGERHDSTTTAAWLLLETLVRSGDMPAALSLVRANLLWLRGADPADLTARQTDIKQTVEQTMSQD